MEVLLIMFILWLCSIFFGIYALYRVILLEHKVQSLENDIHYIYKRLWNVEFPKNVSIKDIKDC